MPRGAASPLKVYSALAQIARSPVLYLQRQHPIQCARRAHEIWAFSLSQLRNTTSTA